MNSKTLPPRWIFPKVMKYISQIRPASNCIRDPKFFILVMWMMIRFNTKWPRIKTTLNLSIQNKRKLTEKDCVIFWIKPTYELLRFCLTATNVFVFVIPSYYFIVFIYITISLQHSFVFDMSIYSPKNCQTLGVVRRYMKWRRFIQWTNAYRNDSSIKSVNLPHLLEASGEQTREIQVLVFKCIFSFRLQPGAACSPWP